MKRKLSLVDTIISTIIVTNNDEDIIQDRLKKIKKALSRLRTSYEILIVDNNSEDATVEKIKNLKSVMSYTRILVLSKSYETEIALTAGLDNCVGDYAILFNPYTDPPEVIPKLIRKLIEGNDIVVGKTRSHIKKYGKVTKRFLKMIQKLSTQGFVYRENYLVAINRKVINSIIRTRRKSRNFSYISSLIGFKSTNLIYKPLKKFKVKIKTESFFEILISIIDTVISNSFKPIRFLSLLGMFLSGLFLLWILGVVILAFVFGKRNIVPQGWISISTVMGTLFFLLFSLLTIISEYLIRILTETRDEPFYFISEEIGKSTILPRRRTLNIV
mgnify:CR=1 FL=1